MTSSPAKLSPAQVLALLEKLAVDSCSSLFEAYGVTLQRVNSGTTPTAPVLLSSIVGFSGPRIRGSCVLAASEKPILASNPLGGSTRDWIAELANQLAGRIKNKLLAHGAEVYVNTPVVLRGEHLAPLPRAELMPLTFATDGGNVFVWIELETNTDVALGPPAVVMAEGETLLF